jgi:hypothetical protein
MGLIADLLGEKPAAGLTRAQALAYLDELAARTPLATTDDETRRSTRRQAAAAKLLAQLTSDPKLQPLKERVAYTRRQLALAEHALAASEYAIEVGRRQIPASLDDLPGHRAKIQQLGEELPLLEGRLVQLRAQHRAAVDDVRRALQPGYHVRVAEVVARRETARAAAKVLVGEAEADKRMVELLEIDLAGWAEE